MVLVSVLVSLNPAAGIDGEVEGGRALPREGVLLLAAPRVEGDPKVLPLPPGAAPGGACSIGARV